MVKCRGGSRISGKGFHMCKDVCVRVCVWGGRSCRFYLIFHKLPIEINNLVSLRPNYFIFIGYLKTGGG